MLQVKDLASFKDFSSDLHSKLVADYMEQVCLCVCLSIA